MAIKKVELTSYNTFQVIKDNNELINGELLVDGNPVLIRMYEANSESISYVIEENIEILGTIAVFRENGKEYPLDVTKAVDFFDFDNRYFYQGDDLGSTYHHDFTSFKLWAPLASRVFLLLKGNKYEMERGQSGVYFIGIDGDLDGCSYKYEILLNGKIIEVIDPYGKSSSSNGRESFVINEEKLVMDMYEENLQKMNSYLDAIVYEANVRDMTIDEYTNIENKGKYLGLIEKGRTTKGGNPAGFDYLVSLGFTHLQLMPILDFETINEDDPKNSYNWGYDPMQFFTIEGSYSTNPNDPYSRMIEFKKMVRAFHKSGIRINIDVVFNHIYEVKTSLLQKITPNYYFRRDDNGKFLNHSYCGNEFASEKPMVRKLFVDSIKFLLKEYHVDGFRFDLMGLLDVTTMNLIRQEALKIKDDVMLYGEGWDMMSEAKDGTPLANMYNAELMPGYAFFNDRYRNIVRGSGGRATLDEEGYLLGNQSYLGGFEFAYMASCYNLTFPPLFKDMYRSLNYVECHDNATLYDTIKYSTNIEEVERLVRKINKVLLLSFGIPFIHAGQEIAASKFKHHNTYNEGDKYNKFSYKLLDERLAMVKALQAYIASRKEIAIFHCNDLNTIEKNVSLIHENNILHIRIVDTRESEPVYHIFINPNEVGSRIYLDSEVDYYFPFGFRKFAEKHPTRAVDISPMQVSIFVETK